MCTPLSETNGWKVIPAEVRRRCTIAENPTLQGLPLVDANETNPISYQTLANIVKQSNFENHTVQQVKQLFIYFEKLKLPIFFHEQKFTDSKTYQIGLQIFCRHFFRMTTENPRTFLFERVYGDALVELCDDRDSFLRVNISMKKASEFLHLVSQRTDAPYIITISDTLSALRFVIEELVNRRAALTSMLKSFIETSFLPELYSLTSNIKFPCYDGLRLWLSLVQIDPNNCKVFVPDLNGKFLKKLWAPVSVNTSLFQTFTLDGITDDDVNCEDEVYYSSTSEDDF